jgi:hypothetical protein
MTGQDVVALNLERPDDRRGGQAYSGQAYLDLNALERVGWAAEGLVELELEFADSFVAVLRLGEVPEGDG